MNTLDFLRKVLPPEGTYVAVTINQNNKPRQTYYNTVEELSQAVLALDQGNDNVYYAVSAFKSRANRKAANVRSTQLLALDIDCGTNKPYAAWKDGLVALGSFVKATGLPKPMVVSSGLGLHVYWVFTDEQAPEQWQPVANALKEACVTHKFNVDPAVPADKARVLRPVGAHNRKNGKEVRLLIDADPVDFATLRDVLLLAKTHITQHTTNSKLAQSLVVQQDLPPSNPTVLAQKCGQIKWGVEHQSEVEEPFWYAMIGVAAFCQNPQQVAIDWSNQHPEFDKQKTITKVTHWMQSASGPTTCKKFQDLRPSGCAKCPVRNKITSPNQLGVQHQEVAPPTHTPDTIALEVPLPKPFKRTATGIKKVIEGTDVDICSFDLYPVGYGRDESLGYEVVRYHWNRPHVGWQELKMRQALLADGSREFSTAIADQGIVLRNKYQTEDFQMLLRSYMEELRQRRTMTNLYGTMGWKENYSQFVLGDLLLRREADGTVAEESIALASTTQRLGSELFQVAGDADQWVAFTTLLEKADLFAHMFSLGVGLSAPFYAFTGLKGITVSFYGPTGGGKTLAQYWQQSIWGPPDKLHFQAKFTQNALFSRMGLYSNLPMTIDEATLVDDTDAGDFLYWVTQGRDKARMNRQAEERDARTWALPVTISTNKSWQSKLMASGLDTGAQMARLLEITVPQHKLFAKDSEAGRKIYTFLMANHGHIGYEFTKYLMELGPERIKAMISTATTTFKQRYQCTFAGEERYWEQCLVLADLALGIAQEQGMIAFDYTKGISWVLHQLGAIRKAVEETYFDAFDTLSEYLNDNADAAVTMWHTGMGRPTPDYNRMPRNDLRIRFDLYRKSAADPFDRGVVLLDRAHLRRWLSKSGVDYRTFLSQISDDGAIATPKSQKAYLGKDTSIKLGQVYVLGVSLNHPKLRGVLEGAAEMIPDDIVQGKPHLVHSTGS